MTRRCVTRAALMISGVAWSVVAAGQAPPVAYEVAFEGVSDPELVEALRSVSQAVALQERPPISPRLLRRRAENDIDRLREALRSRGYYAATVRLELDEEAASARVVFLIDLGPVYNVESVEIASVGETRVPDFLTPEAIGLTPEGPARARRVLDAESVLVNRLREAGYAFARVANRRVVVDHATQGVRVTFEVDPGPQTTFGVIEVEGLETVKPEYIQGRAPWQEGDRYDPRSIAEYRSRLWESGLFSLVQVDSADEPDAAGRVPVRVRVAERPHRTVSAGIGYQTSESLGARVAWEHRNFTGYGDRLRLEIHGSGLTRDARASYRRPGFLRDDQVLTLDVAAIEEDLKPYDSRSLRLGAGIERTVTDRFRWNAGVVLKTAHVEQRDEETRYHLLSTPIGAVWDRRDDPADPTSGDKIELNLTPYLSTGDSSAFFLKTRAEYSRYWRITEKTVLAGRIALGTLTGADREEVPADERFYSGGADSVRGYEYRSLAPLEDDRPVGGASLLEMALEARRRITENISVVVFADAGNAFEDPSFSEIDELQWGAGVGLRYATPVGPFRADIAVPVNRRSGVDDAFQIYLSFGHTF